MKSILASLIVSVLLAGIASAEVVDGSAITVIDGDTVALPCAVPGPGCAEKIRLEGIDTPESFKPHCEQELVAGLKAKERLAGIIRGKRVSISRSGKDRYGRTLGNLHVDGSDVGDILVQSGLALPYAPGRTAKASRIAHWCGPGDW